MVFYFLFAFTFIFGPVSLLTKTKWFNKELTGFFDTVIPWTTPPWFQFCDVVILLFSLGWQSVYWLLLN